MHTILYKKLRRQSFPRRKIAREPFVLLMNFNFLFATTVLIRNVSREAPLPLIGNPASEFGQVRTFERPLFLKGVGFLACLRAPKPLYPSTSRADLGPPLQLVEFNRALGMVLDLRRHFSSHRHYYYRRNNSSILV